MCHLPKTVRSPNKSYLSFAVLAAILIALAASPALADLAGWTITQLTNNTCDDIAPVISGSNIVWTVGDSDDSNDIGIFLYNGSTTAQLTNNFGRPQISGSNVIWLGYDGHDNEVFVYNGSTIVQLTYNDYDDMSPQISGSNAVWQSLTDNSLEIFFYNGSTIIQLTNDNYDDMSPQISGSHIVWISESEDVNDRGILSYNGSKITQLTNTIYEEQFPQVSGSNVVWAAYDGDDYEIFFYDGSTIIQLTNNDYDDMSPQISGSNVVWQGYDYHDQEIFFYNGSATIQLTDNSYDDERPWISGSNIAWIGWDGSNWGIFVYDGSTVIKLANNFSYEDSSFQISGSSVVWQGWDGNDYEIFMAAPNVVISAEPVKFGSYDGLKNVKVTAKDSGNNDVTFSLTGGGYGQIDPCDPNFPTITLYDTTDKSILSITTKGKGVETSVGDIISNGPLKAIMAKTTDLRGNITVNGSLGQLVLDDAIDANTLTIGASDNPKARVNITFDQAQNLIIDSNMPIGVLKMTEWLDTDEIADQVNAPCLSVLQAKGDVKRSIAGDFEADIILDGNFENGASLVNAKIAGDLDGEWDISGNATTIRVNGTLSNDVAIHGSVGSLHVAMLHGTVTIDGDAKNVKVGEPLAVCEPEGGEIGSLYIGGETTVKSGRDSIKFSGGELYTSDANMYRLEDLRLYDVLGRSWTYNETYRVSGSGISESGSETVTISVDDTLSNIDGHDCTVVRVSSVSGGNSSMAWYTDDSGTHLVNWITDSDIGNVTIEVDSPLIAPAFLRLGQKNTGTATFNGTWNFSAYGYDFDGTISGQANVSSKLLGHQEVTVPSGTYLAAKIEETVTMSGPMTIQVTGDEINGTFNGTFYASSVQTSWAVPEVGVVRAVSSATVRVSIAGAGSASVTVNGTDELTGYSD